MVCVSLVLGAQLGGIEWECGDSVSVLLVSACLLLAPSDKSCTSLLFARADLALSGNPFTDEELYWAEVLFLGSLQNLEIEI